MKNFLAVSVFAAAASLTYGASAATLSSVNCSGDVITYNFTGISGTTSVTMEASQDGSSWAIMGLGDLDSLSGSQSVSIPTNLSEVTDVISNKSTASYRATSSGATQTVSCS